MDKQEAGQILRSKIEELRSNSYQELRSRIDQPEAIEVRGSSLKVYQLEWQVFWDDKPEGDLRVMVCIDDGGVSAFWPTTEDFIIAPDGSFVGE